MPGGLAKVTRRPNLTRIDWVRRPPLFRVVRGRRPWLAVPPHAIRIRFSGRSALLAAGRGSEAPGATSRRRRWDPNGARSPGPSSTITGRVPARVRSRFDPRAAPTAPNPDTARPSESVYLGVQGFGWRGILTPRFILRAARPPSLTPPPRSPQRPSRCLVQSPARPVYATAVNDGEQGRRRAQRDQLLQSKAAKYKRGRCALASAT